MDKKYSVVICDDNEVERKLVCDYIYAFSEEYGYKVEIHEFDSGVSLLASDILFDILILDIDMPGLNGINTAKQLNDNRDYSKYRIILLSGLSGDWVREGYKIKAIRYVSKPIVEKDLFDSLNVAIEELNPGIPFGVMENGTKTSIYSNDVYYVKSGGDYSIIYTKDACYDKSCSLCELLTSLSERYLFLCHRSYIVNLKYIKRITDKGIEMKDGTIIPYSRRKKKSLYDAFLKSRF